MNNHGHMACLLEYLTGSLVNFSIPIFIYVTTPLRLGLCSGVSGSICLAWRKTNVGGYLIFPPMWKLNPQSLAWNYTFHQKSHWLSVPSFPLLIWLSASFGNLKSSASLWYFFLQKMEALVWPELVDFLLMNKAQKCWEPAQEILPMTRSCGETWRARWVRSQGVLCLSIYPPKPESACLIVLCFSHTTTFLWKKLT